MALLLSVTGCDVHIGDDRPDDQYEEPLVDKDQVSGYEEIPAIDYKDYESYKEQQEKEEATLQFEQQKIELFSQYPSSIDETILEELNGSVTFASSSDSSKKYTVSFDASKLSYLGELQELWNHEEEGYLFGDDASDADNVIVVTYVPAEDYHWFLQNVEMAGMYPMVVEARSDALMYIYEGYYKDEYYWDVFFRVDTIDGIEGVLFSNVSQEYMEQYEVYEAYDLTPVFGELKIHE